MIRPAWIYAGAAALLLSACAAPPLTMYTMDAPMGNAPAGNAPTGNAPMGNAPMRNGPMRNASRGNARGAAAHAVPLGKKPVVIAVARVTAPDEIDTQDIVVRDGNMLQRSHQGRWATRLSLGITDRLTQRLAERRPAALVTARPLIETPAYRVLINIQRLDITTAGVGTLDADWLVLPRDPAAPAQRDRGHFSVAGPVTTDRDVVAVVETLSDRLAAAIELPAPERTRTASRHGVGAAPRRRRSAVKEGQIHARPGERTERHSPGEVAGNS